MNREDLAFLILKPDCLECNLVGEVLARFEKEGLKVLFLQTSILDRDVLERHYRHLSDRPFFDDLLSFMMRGPVILCVLQGEKVCEKARDVVGGTDPNIAKKGSIRATFGKNERENVVHCSDGPVSAVDEIQNFSNSGYLDCTLFL